MGLSRYIRTVQYTLSVVLIITSYSQVTQAIDYVKRRKMDGIGVRNEMNNFYSYEYICDHEFEFHLRGVDLKFLNSLLLYLHKGFSDFQKWFELFL
ncbi:unnamed protein product [Heterobilharzia americana]|nr:unnamed protein product [Heterobilharzia americana]CAH8646219.1 unnamed protein product [Heterobilharzia americana]